MSWLPPPVPSAPLGAGRPSLLAPAGVDLQHGGASDAGSTQRRTPRSYDRDGLATALAVLADQHGFAVVDRSSAEFSDVHLCEHPSGLKIQVAVIQEHRDAAAVSTVVGVLALVALFVASAALDSDAFSESPSSGGFGRKKSSGVEDAFAEISRAGVEFLGLGHPACWRKDELGGATAAVLVNGRLLHVVIRSMLPPEHQMGWVRLFTATTLPFLDGSPAALSQLDAAPRPATSSRSGSPAARPG